MTTPQSNEEIWRYDLGRSDESRWAPWPTPSNISSTTGQRTALLLIRYRYMTEYYCYPTRPGTLGSPEAARLHSLENFVFDLSNAILDPIFDIEPFPFMPLNQRDSLVNQISHVIMEYIPQATRRFDQNICLELDVVRQIYIVNLDGRSFNDDEGHENNHNNGHDDDDDDDDGGYERVVNESFDAEQEHAILRRRPAPPKLLGSLVSEVCTEEKNIEYQCVICMEEFVVGEKVQRLPCSHCFHDDCIFCWLTEKDTCPICRYGGQFS